MLEDSQASDYERYLLGARILSVNDFAISNLEDFGQKVTTALQSEKDMTISFIPRFVSVPGMDKFDAPPPPARTRRASYLNRQISKRLGSFTSNLPARKPTNNDTIPCTTV